MWIRQGLWLKRTDTLSAAVTDKVHWSLERKKNKKEHCLTDTSRAEYEISEGKIFGLKAIKTHFLKQFSFCKSPKQTQYSLPEFNSFG